MEYGQLFRDVEDALVPLSISPHREQDRQQRWCVEDGRHATAHAANMMNVHLATAVGLGFLTSVAG